MAGNDAIRFLRGDSSKKSANITLLAGQPFYETNTNKLYVGDGKTALNKLSSITSNVENNINTLNNRVSNLDPYKYFWQGLFAKRLAVRVGDRSFITINEYAYPALCVDTYESSGNINSVWQVSYIVEKKELLLISHPTWGQTNSNKWGTTVIYNYLNNNIYSLLPTYLQSYIVPVDKSMGTYTTRPSGSTYYDIGASSRLWIPSAQEIWGPSVNWLNVDRSGISVDGGSTQFEYYKQLLGDNANPQDSKVAAMLAPTVKIWLRNYSGPYNEGFYPRGCLLDTSGFLDNSVGYSQKNSLVFCFVLGQLSN